MKGVALNAYVNGGIERLCKWWLWTPMKMMALNAYVHNGSERICKWWLWTLMKMMALNAYENGGFERLWKWRRKLDNFYTGDMPQYHGCIKLLKCPMKQAAANIAMRKKQHLMTKVSRSININFFIFQINSLSIDLKDKAQQMHIIIWQKNNYGENKSSHKLLTRESVDTFWVKSDGSILVSSNVIRSKSQYHNL